jgi:hypothetical protein
MPWLFLCDVTRKLSAVGRAAAFCGLQLIRGSTLHNCSDLCLCNGQAGIEAIEAIES